MSISFRQATSQDIANILFIERESFAAGIKESKSVFLERLITFPAGFILLEVDGCSKPVGYICSELWQYQQTVNEEQLALGHSIKNTHQPQGSELYISSMGVLPAFRGHGYGKLLLQELITNIKSRYPWVISVLLIVAEQWQVAQAIYGKLGFEQVAVIPAFFKQVGRSTIDGIIMRKIIGQC
jgi:ribosomal-protein-alanine N-acetyltransferase